MGERASMRSLVVFAALAAVVQAYNATVLPETGTWSAFDQNFALVENPHYGLHYFARGANSSLFHKYQTSPFPSNGSSVLFSDWKCLSWEKGNTSAGFVDLIFWDDPVAVSNLDGRTEVFIRLKSDNNLWQLYQTDAKDPEAWT